MNFCAAVIADASATPGGDVVQAVRPKVAVFSGWREISLAFLENRVTVPSNVRARARSLGYGIIR